MSSITDYLKEKRLLQRGEEDIIGCIAPEVLNELTCVLENRSRRFECDGTIRNMSRMNMRSILSRMLIERLENKAAAILKRAEKCCRNWEEVLFRTLVQSFGFGIQSKEFEELSEIIDFNALGKHRDSLLQIEAILFGQAGLLEEESIPHYYRSEATAGSYYKELVREYRFFCAKFNLQSMDHKRWGNGHGTPHLRIARIAAIYHSHKFSLAEIAACYTTTQLYSTLCVPLQGYWFCHGCFGGTESYGNDKLKTRQADVLIINSVVPVMYVYGKYRNDSALCSKAEDFLYSLKSEENSIIKRWKEKGLEPENAADSQALLQLWRGYCQTNSCDKCPVAYHHIKAMLAEHQ